MSTDIVVNGSMFLVKVEHLSYDDVALLAGKPDDKDLTVVYECRPAGDRRRAGTLIPGHSIDIEDGMIFNAVNTGAA